MFRDHGVSGRAASRPGLDRALATLRSTDLLVVWRLDRLGRSLSHLISVVTELELRAAGLVSLTEQIDTSSPGGRLLFHVMGALAEFERSLIVERTRAGLAAARDRGIRLGRPSRLSTAQQSKAVELIRAGRAIREVAIAMKVHPRTISRLLRRPNEHLFERRS